MAKEYIPSGHKRYRVNCRIIIEVTAVSAESARSLATGILDHKFPANASYHVGAAFEKYSPETVYTSETFTR